MHTARLKKSNTTRQKETKKNNTTKRNATRQNLVRDTTQKGQLKDTCHLQENFQQCSTLRMVPTATIATALIEGTGVRRTGSLGRVGWRSTWGSIGSRHQVGWGSWTWRIPIVVSVGRWRRWRMRWFMPCRCRGTPMTLIIFVARCGPTSRIRCIIPTRIWPPVVVVLSKTRLPVVMIVPIPTPACAGRWPRLS